MKIATVDFEKILMNYKPYQESLEYLESYKNEFSSSMDKIREEMQRIVNSSRSLLLDEKTKGDNIQRMRELQLKASESESEFRSDFSEKQNDELDKNFKKVVDIITNLANGTNSNGSGFDLILNKNSVVFQKSNLEITDDVINEISKLGMISETQVMD